MSEMAVSTVEVIHLSGRSFSSNKVEPPSPAFQPLPSGCDWGGGRVRVFMRGPPPGGLCPPALPGCLLHVDDNKEKVSE